MGATLDIRQGHRSLVDRDLNCRSMTAHTSARRAVPGLRDRWPSGHRQMALSQRVADALDWEDDPETGSAPKESLMKILISAASKHGATDEIARAIGGVLAAAGIDADVRRPEDVSSVAPYDGFVLGSAVYAGHWLGSVKGLIERESATLATKPVWLFSSGPIGHPAKPLGDPADVARLRELTHALDHRIFAGKVDPDDLGFAEKAIFTVLRSPTGDFRSWPEVTAWATTIAEALRVPIGS